MPEFISLNNKSIPTTNSPPESYVISAMFVVFNIPWFKNVADEKSKGPGIKEGGEKGEVAEYSLSIYLYLYPKHTNLSSK